MLSLHGVVEIRSPSATGSNKFKCRRLIASGQFEAVPIVHHLVVLIKPILIERNEHVRSATSMI